MAIVDPDVFCVGALDDVLSPPGAIQALPVPSPRGTKINGLSPREADEIHLGLGEPREVDFHYGGEFYGIPQSSKDHIMDRVDQAWLYSLDLWKRGRPHFTTEEHILNFALADAPVTPADTFVRRIWTAHSFRTVSGDEHDLLLWHLPAEKDRGFRRLYPSVVDVDSWFWRSDHADFVRRSGRAFGLHSRGPFRMALDIAGSAARAINDAGGRSSDRKKA
ncbi:hypothetical protein [Microbacterium testaceum]|uniref:hypothetical protein n=1 Tax=Microbacterium testaceum TaxID=2033 RepID=UPI0025B06B55|nr:hypothetical protein [Microbacterium testaceum]WJS89637.1 hypothetical protein NYQ11_09810 [Microbacterium testaceum]